MKEIKAEVGQVDQAPEIPFEEVESMVDEALALPPPREFHIQVRTF